MQPFRELNAIVRVAQEQRSLGSSDDDGADDSSTPSASKRRRTEREEDEPGAADPVDEMAKAVGAVDWMRLFPTMMEVSHDAMAVLVRENQKVVVSNSSFEDLACLLGQNNVDAGTQIFTRQVPWGVVCRVCAGRQQ